MRLLSICAAVVASGCGAVVPSDEGTGTTVEEITTGPPIDPTIESTGPGCAEALQPFRDGWREVAALPFPGAAIETVFIGGTQTNDNFANRGDVIVEFGGADEIVIEMRRFTMAIDDADAQADFDALQLWAFRSSDLPLPPDAMDPALDCTAQWADGCRIRVFFDGLAQPLRSGADLRVTLPAAWRGDIEVATEDNDADSDFVNRGNVCVAGLRGGLDVALGSGVALVDLADDVAITPHCPAADVDACVASGWDPNCPCLQSFAFGRVAIEAQAARVDVDLPAALWTSVDLGTLEGCTASVELPDYETVPGTIASWRSVGTANYPGPPAVNGGGWSVGVSTGCRTDVVDVAPDAFECTATPSPMQRGDLTVCSGCLGALDCDAALPD